MNLETKRYHVFDPRTGTIYEIEMRGSQITKWAWLAETIMKVRPL
jgi:hypothetical protein